VGVGLSVNSYVVLGFLKVGARSGYEIKRAADASTRFFWVLSPPQIYSELSILEEAGLVKGHSEPRGERRRRLFELTPAGEEALVRWLHESGPMNLEVRDPALLKLFFADALPAGEILGHVQAMRRRAERMLEIFEQDILPLAEQTDANGLHYPLIASSFGHGLYRWMLQWATELEARLEKDPVGAHH
jgi:DNA-binding PadR family transcriptional regulator